VLLFSRRRRHKRWSVTGVQTCALPISEKKTRAVPQGNAEGKAGARTKNLPASRGRLSRSADGPRVPQSPRAAGRDDALGSNHGQIGRASCRERVERSGGAASLEQRRKM